MGEKTPKEGELSLREVVVGAFFIDRHEVANGEYDRCVRAGACGAKLKYPGFTGKDQPAVPVTWRHARAFCDWAGKRLPTEAEWEKAARGADGREYPWGNDPPDCAKASYDACEPHETRPVGSFPPNQYGLFDMAGNSYEWVADWFAPDPAAACPGEERCPGHPLKVVKGGSWYWPADALRCGHRRAMPPESGNHRLGFRCAADIPPPGTAVAALPPQEAAIVRAVPPDPTPAARADERHYVHSNEAAHDLFFPYIRDAGGAYVGVGSDQNYTLIAAARPSVAWIVDYDPVVIGLHAVHRAFILASPSPAAFAGLWRPAMEKEALAAIRAQEADPARSGELVALYRKYRKVLSAYFARFLAPAAAKHPTWLTGGASYAFVRGMHAAGRIACLDGNLLGPAALAGIGAAAAKLSLTVKVVYLTNAEEFISYQKGFAAWVQALPLDGGSVLLRTLNASQGFEKGDYKWHYNVQSALDFRQRLAAGLAGVRPLMRHAAPTAVPGVTTIGL